MNGHISENNRHSVDFYQKMNLNDNQDVSILRFEHATTLEIERLRSGSGVKKAESEAVAKVYSEIATDSVQKMVADIMKVRPADTQGFHGIKLTLPKESAELVKEVYQSHNNILEYGSGGSTALALELGADRVVTVESDKKWADDIAGKLAAHYDEDRFWIYHANIGATRGWGRPRNSKGFREFYRYPTEIWDQLGDWHPDVVFIDGRFRAACFVTTMLRIKRPVTVLFDDYTNRRQYHVVEEFAKPVQQAGRLVRFEIEPQVFNPEKLTAIMSLYSDPD